jgi:glycosyltransferase involved in cell wall biosynthesis
MNIMQSILRSATRNKKEKLNCISFCCHERYDHGLSSTGHNFYAYRQEGMKDWNTNYAPVPSNYILLSKNGEHGIPNWVDFDLILVNNKMANYEIGYNLSRKLNIPMICLEHCLPPTNWTEKEILHMRSFSGQRNVFISEFSRNKWLCDDLPNTHVIHHMVDSKQFCPSIFDDRENIILSVVNLWAQRDMWCGWNLYQRTINGLPFKVVGDNPGLSLPAKNTEELVKEYQRAKIFYNTSLVSPIPTSLLEAAACGCACVSTNNCMIPEIFEHGVDAFLSNDENELRGYLELLLKDDDLAQKMGQKAREKIKKMFNKERFICDWNKVFYGAIN